MFLHAAEVSLSVEAVQLCDKLFGAQIEVGFGLLADIGGRRAALS
jgi:hypothetical protein